MKLNYWQLVTTVLLLSSCATTSNQGTIAELNTVNIELKDVDVEGGLEKAMKGYQQFLEKTPESQMTPEALRRLADLKVEKEYGAVTGDEELDNSDSQSTQLAKPEVSTKPISAIDPLTGSATGKSKGLKVPPVVRNKESDKEFEKRATKKEKLKSGRGKEKLKLPKGEAGADLENAGAVQAIRLYLKLLKKYPNYERNDQVLYQLSRAYEETGQVNKAMDIMNRLVKQYPHSRYNDEVHFRRGEYYFTRKKYLDAEDAYGEVLKMGVGTVYYERALYKKGWTFYKQELYEEALKEFFTLLDYKVSVGYDFEAKHSKIEQKRIEDTFRVVSLSFSNIGGSATIQEYFSKNGARDYEYKVYKELAEFYFSKRRYNDAATTYNAFISSNPFHKKSPHYSMRVIDIYLKGHFPKLVIEAKKQFASTYGLHAEYWKYFNQAEYPEVLGYLKTNLTDLANHYHSLYQNKKYVKNKSDNFNEASHWYKEFLTSFPKDKESPVINYQLADLYLENKDFKLSAIEYEHSAYDYPVNEKSQKAAYAAVYAYREYLKMAPVSQLKNVKKEIVRVSLRLVDTFPKHEKATIVLGAAVDDLFEMRDFTLAIKVGRRLIAEYPKADPKIRRGAWLVVAHSSYETEIYPDAELAYIEVLKLTDKEDKSRLGLVDNLAASIYKQGEQAKKAENYNEAVRHFLRIADVAPTSKIRPTAEYDAAAVLLQIMDLERAVNVLLAFRNNYPGNKLQKDVTKKIAYAYKELAQYTKAAKEFERVAQEADTEDLVREAMLTAAELYEKAKDSENSLRIYKTFVAKFPKPLEFALETYYKIAMIYKTKSDLLNYRNTLQHIIKSDAQAGKERTDRTRYLAAQSSLVIIEPQYDEYIALKLVKPFKKSLKKKQKDMKNLVSRYTSLVDYQVADVTAAATFYIAEIYYNFSRSLIGSEKPDNLSDVELEEFNSMLEDQAFPFEEKAIKVHEKNIELLTSGIFSTWIDRSIEKLAKLVPARFDKPEEKTDYITKIDNYIYSSPRFIREDASTGIIVDLDFFRYSSQNLAQSYHKNQTKGDIDNQVSVNQDGNSSEVQQHTPSEEALKTQDSGNANSDSLKVPKPPQAESTSGKSLKAAEQPSVEQTPSVTDTQQAKKPKEVMPVPDSTVTARDDPEKKSGDNSKDSKQVAEASDSDKVHQTQNGSAPVQAESGETKKPVVTNDSENESLQPQTQ